MTQNFPSLISALTTLENSRANRADRIWKRIFIAACILSFLLIVIPGRSPSIDEEFFKSAGRHWAATGQFAAPEIVGRIEVDPGLDKVYFAQPPIYTFLFGLYTKAIGFGPRRCIAFDQLIHLLLVSLTILLARRLFRVSPRYAYALGSFLLFPATFGRPDELAMSIGILGILAWTLDLSPVRRATLAGIAFGLCGATSIGVFVFFAPMALLVGYQHKALRISTFLLAIAAGAVVACCCVAPILITHPDAISQLLVHASVQSPQLGQNVDAGKSRLDTILSSYAEGLQHVFAFHRDIALVILAALAVSLVCLHYAAKSPTSSRTRALRQCLWIAIAGLVLEWAILPGKAPYLWFFAPWLLSIAGAAWPDRSPNRPTLAIAALSMACLAFVLLDYARERTAILLLPPEQSFTVAMNRVRNAIPAGATVVTYEYWWALADKCSVLDPSMSHPNPIVADYFVKTGNGSDDPGKAAEFFPYYEDYARDHHFVVLEDYVTRTPPRIAGVPVYPGVKGFGERILANPETRFVTPAAQP